MTRRIYHVGGRSLNQPVYDISEYRAVSPLPGEPFYIDPDAVPEASGTTFKVLLVVSSDDMHALGGVVVESWDHVVGREKSGSKNRKYLAAFTEKERKKIGSWKALYWKWEMRSGYPYKGVTMTPETYHLLKRAADFFATI
jgi:hypothetical protein